MRHAEVGEVNFVWAAKFQYSRDFAGIDRNLSLMYFQNEILMP